MRRDVLRAVVFAASLAAWLVSPDLTGGQARTQSQLLQDAIQLIETNGDVRSAIPLLQEASKGADRAVAARAWLILGDAYEKLGVGEAVAAYLKAEGFKDQPAIVAEARVRRERLAATTRRIPETPTFSRLWTGEVGLLGPPSLDGQWLPVVDWRSGELCLRNATTDEMRPATRGGRFAIGGASPTSAAISPDGRRIAYGYRARATEASTTGELRVTSVTGTDAKTLLTRPGQAILVGGWTPDGREVLVIASSDVMLIQADSGTPRLLASLPAAPTSARLSPDGRFVAYDVPQPGSSDRDITVRDVTTGTEHTVIRHRANDRDPVWMPDGQRLVFASDRTGAMGIWQVAIDRGRAAGEPDLVHANIGRSVLMGLSVTGALYLGQSAGARGDDWETWVLEHAIQVPATGRRF